MSKPSIPQGTRDFGPDVVRKRNYIFNTIRNVFELYGFQPLETPAMENLETLMGKYGEEGDKLIYRILDSGNPFPKEFFEGLLEMIRFEERLYQTIKRTKGLSDESLDELFSKPLIEWNPSTLASYAKEFLENDEKRSFHLAKLKNISNKALKYDLTIPFARYVAMNHNQLTFPFKRYQIQPVWRADRPQKGRYREFYQCDADVVGSNSLLNEVELILIVDEIYTKLSKYFSEKDENRISICINNRKIWAGVAELCGCADKVFDITIALDKYDKIGLDGVKKELIKKGFNEEQTNIIFGCLFPDVNEEYYTYLELTQIDDFSDLEKETIINLFGNHKDIYRIIDCLVWNFKEKKIKIGLFGVKEILQILHPFIKDVPLYSSSLQIDSTLARGLNYYTGTIIEVKAPSFVEISSIGGGGRYDDLTGLFGVPNIPGVGISFGVDRIYDVMEELKLFPENVYIGTQALFFNLGETESKKAFELMQELRQKGVRCELYHEQAKFDKQFKYAEKKNIPYIIIIGSNEIKDKTCSIKNIKTGEQQTISQSELLNNHNF